MAKTSSGSIGVTITGDGVTSEYVPSGSPVVNTAAPSGGTTPLVLAAGTNTVSVPSGAIGFVLSPPTSSTNGKTLKGIAGDTGVPLRPNAPSMLYLPNGAVSFVITSVGIETCALQWL